MINQLNQRLTNYGPWNKYGLHLSLQIKFYWHTDLLICIHILYGYLYSVMAKLSSCSWGCDSRSLKYLLSVLYRKVWWALVYRILFLFLITHISAKCHRLIFLGLCKWCELSFDVLSLLFIISYLVISSQLRCHFFYYALLDLPKLS